MNHIKCARDINETVSGSESMQVGNVLGVLQSLDVPTTLISELMEEIQFIKNGVSLIDLLNASTPLEEDQKRFWL